MAYIRPCNKCGQRISMREMRAGQWVAFDVSTEKPHKCGKKNKADPAIKKLAKQKNKEEDIDSVDLGYDSEIDNEIKILEERLEDIKKKENQNYISRKNKINETVKIDDNTNFQKNDYDKNYETKEEGFGKYFWIFALLINAIVITRCVSD